MRDKLILYSVKPEFKKLFFVIGDLKVLPDPQITKIINQYPWFTAFCASHLLVRRGMMMIRDFTSLFFVILRYKPSK